MSLQVKLKEEELAFVDIIRHPILGPEFIRNFNDIPEEEGVPVDFQNKLYYYHRSYQINMLCDFNNYVTYCCARQVGKTESLIDKITFYLLNDFWKTYIVFIAPNKNQMDPVFFKLRSWLETNDFLKHLVKRGGINAGNLTVRLATGATLDCRIAGQSGTGQNVVGLHTPIVLIDEAAYFPWGTWQELQPIVNSWMDGFQVVVAGVPDGRREKSVLYHVDQKAELYSHHRISSHMNPVWNEVMEQKAQEDYGGVTSEDYLHMVLGQHGSPTFAVFDRALMRLEDYDTAVRQVTLSDFRQDSQIAYRQILELPSIPKNSEYFIFGIDLGMTDPTAIVGMYLSNERWRQLFRLNWQGIEYPEQMKWLAYLDAKYNPQIIGMDEGHSGLAFIQGLIADERYQDRKFKDRIEGINFAKVVPIGKDEDGKELTVRAKEFSVHYIQQMTNSFKIAYSIHDEKLLEEFERTTYTKSSTGNIQFKTWTARGGERGADHNLSAYLAGFLAWYLRQESLFYITPKPKLARTRWFFT